MSLFAPPPPPLPVPVLTPQPWIGTKAPASSSLLGTTINAKSTVAGGSLSPGSVGVPGSTINAKPVVVLGSLAAAAALQGSPINALLTVVNGVAVPGSVGIAGSVINAPLVVVNGAAAPGSVTLTGSVTNALLQVIGGSVVAAGGETLAGNTINASLTVINGSLDPGSVSISGQTISALLSVIGGSVAPGAVGIAGNVINAPFSVNLGLLGELTSISGSTIDAKFAVVSGQLDPGNVSLLGAAINALFNAVSGTVTAGSVGLPGQTINAPFVVVSGAAVGAGASTLIGTTIDAKFVVVNGAVTLEVTITSTPLDISLRPTIEALINRLGKDAIIETEDQVHDPATGAAVDSNVVQHDVLITPPFNYVLRYVHGDVVRDGDLLFGIAHRNIPFTMRRGLKVIIDGVEFSIVKYDTIYTGEQVGLYMAYVRGTGVIVPSTTAQTALDRSLVPKVLSLVNRLGKTGKITSVSSYTFNPANGSVTENGATTQFKKVTPPEEYSRYVVDGDSIKLGDMKVLLPASGLSFVPARGFSIKIDSVTFDIVRVEPIYTGKQVGAYQLQLRR